MHTIEINMGIKCKRCGEGGATPNGYCLSCISKNIKEGKYNHVIDKHLANQSSMAEKGGHNPSPNTRVSTVWPQDKESLKEDSK